MTTTRTITREYDAQGRLVREVEVVITTPEPYYVAPVQWWQPVPIYPTITCSSSLTKADDSLRTYN